MKIEVVCEITTTFVVTDTGYTRKMSLPEVEDWAKQKLSTIQVLIKQGGAEPKPVAASFVIKSINFTPDGADK